MLKYNGVLGVFIYPIVVGSVTRYLSLWLMLSLAALYTLFQLVNIIWGEADESDDHIVPYPDGSEERPAHLFGHHIKKEWNEEASHVKPTETKISVAKSELSRGNVQQNSQDAAYGLPAAGLGVGSSVDLSMSNAAKSDRDSMGTVFLNHIPPYIEIFFLLERCFSYRILLYLLVTSLFVTLSINLDSCIILQQRSQLN